MRKILLLIFTQVFLTSAGASVAEAATGGFGLSIEPIIGYEHVQKIVPTPHSKNRLIYGARARAGLLLLSLEAEYTRGTDTEDFPQESLQTKDSAEKVKLGLRSGFRLSSLLGASARAGVQASQNTHEETRAGVTSSAIEPVKYKPYAGAGVDFRLSSKITASADVTVVFNDINDLGQNEYQTTAGFAVRFP